MKAEKIAATAVSRLPKGASGGIKPVQASPATWKPGLVDLGRGKSKSKNAHEAMQKAYGRGKRNDGDLCNGYSRNRNRSVSASRKPGRVGCEGGRRREEEMEGGRGEGSWRFGQAIQVIEPPFRLMAPRCPDSLPTLYSYGTVSEPPSGDHPGYR